MSTANLTREDTARRKTEIDVLGYRVELDLRDAAPATATDAGATTFPTRTTVEFAARTDRTWLDFLGARVDAVTVNGLDVPVRYDGARIELTGLGSVNVVTVEARGTYSRSGEGMHRFTDPVDGATYLYTQYEPADVRRVFACFEQPDLKAPFTFVVEAPESWQVLSNQRVAHRRGDRVTFEPTLPISTYITAVVAGPYHRVESDWRRGDLVVPLGIYCRASLAPHLDAEEIVEITRQGMDFYAEHFDYPYPFGKYDQVFVPEYNLGAMENPGCVTFTEAYIFRGASTEEQHQRRANTVLHEMAHMWFGDLVTMAWWDDLWLKESFADYMGALVGAEATRFDDAWVAFANRRKAWAYLQDQLPTTHPIVADIGDLEAAKLNFDGITYAKGASVLKQLVAYVGREAFFTGARRYFRAHEFGNTTLADLLAVLEESSGRDLTEWSRRWLETSGVSTLSWDGTAIVQTDPRPHRIAVGRYEPDAAGRLVRVERLELDLVEERTPVDIAPAAVVLLNDDDLTYAKVRLDESSLRTVEEALDRIVDPLARGLVWSALWNATRDAELDVDRYLSVARRHAPAETSNVLLTSVLGNAAFAIAHYLPVEQRPAAWQAWLDTVWNEVQRAAPRSDAQLSWARALAAASAFDGRYADGIRALLEPPKGHERTGRLEELAVELVHPDPDLRWALWTALVATGNADADDLDRELADDDTGSGRTAYLRALTSAPDPDVKATVWARIHRAGTQDDEAQTDGTLSNDQLDAVVSGFTAGGRADLTGPYAGAYFVSLRQVWERRSIELARRFVVGLFPDSESTDDADAWLTDNGDAPAALRRLVLEQRDHLARALRARARSDRPR